MSERAERRRRSPWATVASLHRKASYGRWFRWHLAVALAVFLASGFAGYAVLDALPIEDLAALAPSDSPLPEFGFRPILFNNLRVLLLLFLGSVTGGLIALFVLVVNGAVVGGVVAVVSQETAWSVILAALVPHGVVELSAFFVAAAVGLRVPHRVARYLLGYEDTPLTRVEAFELAVIGVATALMIAVAAWIEVAVTPEVVRWVGGPDALPT